MAFNSFVRRAFVRKYSSSAKNPLEHVPPEEAEKTGEMWKKIFFFGAIPVIVLGHINVYMKTKEEEHEERPPYVAYDCLYIRNKKYPWRDGVKTLFHNPHHNPIPGVGYEDE